MIYRTVITFEPTSLTLIELFEEVWFRFYGDYGTVAFSEKHIAETMMREIMVSYRVDIEGNLREELEKFVKRKVEAPRISKGELILAFNTYAENGTIKRYEKTTDTSIMTADGRFWNFCIPLKSYEPEDDEHNRMHTVGVKDGIMYYA